VGLASVGAVIREGGCAGWASLWIISKHGMAWHAVRCCAAQQARHVAKEAARHCRDANSPSPPGLLVSASFREVERVRPGVEPKTSGRAGVPAKEPQERWRALEGRVSALLARVTGWGTGGVCPAEAAELPSPHC
jgi:hypothetical protein